MVAQSIKKNVRGVSNFLEITFLKHRIEEMQTKLLILQPVQVRHYVWVLIAIFLAQSAIIVNFIYSNICQDFFDKLVQKKPSVWWLLLILILAKPGACWWFSTTIILTLCFIYYLFLACCLLTCKLRLY